TSLTRTLTARFGVKLSGENAGFLQNVVAVLPDIVGTVVISSRQPALLEQSVAVLRRRHVHVFFEVSSLVTARSAEKLGVDGLIATGHEAGGRIGDETTFILLQRLKH